MSYHSKTDTSLRAIALSLALIPLLLLWVPMQQMLAFFQQASVSSVWSWQWLPEYEYFGFGLPLVGSLVLVLLALPIAIVLGWFICVQLHEHRHHWLHAVVIPTLEMWVSLPSVVIGVWAVSQVVPLVRFIGGSGYGLLTTVIGLAVFIVPVSALLFYRSYQRYQAQYGALERSLNLNVLQRTELYARTCRGAVISTSLYTFCRLFGETMIVLMLSGNSLQIPTHLTDGLRTLTATIALEMGYASDLHELSLFAMSGVAIVVVGAVIGLKMRMHDVSA